MVCYSHTVDSMKTISVSDLEVKLKENPQLALIDVRTAAEFRAAHIEQAVNIPLDDLRDDKLMELSAGNELIFICQSGKRGEMACKKVADSNAEVVNVEGGTQAWIDAGKDYIKGSGVISIERQVRIGAGSLVLLGLAIAYWVHPGGAFLSAFVGAGLIFAGVTDYCGMGLVLAKMPWNR